MKVTLGGERLGSGNRMKVDLHGYERSTHDLSYLWRSTMAAGTLVPFMSEVALPGDTFDIVLNCDVRTHPTIGPLFGNEKVQLDVFQAPIRLYNSLLHNNALGIGLNMSQVKFPVIEMTATVSDFTNTSIDRDNSQINPSALLKYLGLSGIGKVNAPQTTKTRQFNAASIIAYYDIYKNYYANKQEEIGAVLHTPSPALIQTVTDFVVNGTVIQHNAGPGAGQPVTEGMLLQIQYSGTVPDLTQIYVYTVQHGLQPVQNIAVWNLNAAGTTWNGYVTIAYDGDEIDYWQYGGSTTPSTGKPAVVTFPLSNIDDMRNAILAFQSTTQPYKINSLNKEPYKWLYEINNGIPNSLSSQEGLALKTYQSDLFNNWIKTEYIDGPNGINEITAIDTSGGSFTLDTLNLSRKIYNMMNRIAVSGGTYDDWLDVNYDHPRYTRASTPMYMGGLIKELEFQEVISNSQSSDQPLGTLGGRGVMGKKHKGGTIVIKVDEPSYIIGIVSITPRLDYSQGNRWDLTQLFTVDDLHKPALDEIGFQELITEKMAWWTTYYDSLNWVTQSAGKQPAWLDYMTNYNRVYGNFAIKTNEMFMTLNRRYEYNTATGGIKDLTTYIDPSKFNTIFAETQLDAQNYWTQIAVNITSRRKMSAKLMPNL